MPHARRHRFVRAAPPRALLAAAFLMLLGPLRVGHGMHAPHHETVDRIIALLEERYIFPDIAAACGEQLAALQAAGAFDDAMTPEALASRLTEVLRRVSRDEHLLVRARARAEPPASPTAAPTAAPTPSHPVTVRAEREERSRRQNFGVASVQHLEGNLGYLDLRFFHGSPRAQEVVAAAMTVLAQCVALIIDLRQNEGGYPQMVQFLCSYFFDEPTHLNSLFWREGERTDEFWTVPVPGGPRPDVPLLILTSERTFSGAEEFSYNLQARGRATIVGESTRGGAHPSALVPIDDDVEIIIPIGRAINPITGTNWEGVGVTPDVPVAADDALEAARGRATLLAEASRRARAARHQAFDPWHVAARQLADAGDPVAASARVVNDLRVASSLGLVTGGDLAQFGFEFLREGRRSMGLAVLALNEELHPDSPFAAEALGDGHREAGDVDAARAAYVRARERTSDPEMRARLDERLSSLDARPNDAV